VLRYWVDNRASADTAVPAVAETAVRSSKLMVLVAPSPVVPVVPVDAVEVVELVEPVEAVDEVLDVDAVVAEEAVVAVDGVPVVKVAVLEPPPPHPMSANRTDETNRVVRRDLSDLFRSSLAKANLLSSRFPLWDDANAKRSQQIYLPNR
jgi:hypothetical protein